MRPSTVSGSPMTIRAIGPRCAVMNFGRVIVGFLTEGSFRFSASGGPREVGPGGGGGAAADGAAPDGAGAVDAEDARA